MTTGVRELCARLAGEPLFSTRELFHSDLLAWMIDNVSGVRAVFDGWGVPADTLQLPTLREWKRFDLVVRSSGRSPLVVENKTFSPVSDNQLEKYTARALAEFAPSGLEPVFVLLGLGDPGWPDGMASFGGRTWTYRSYGELGKALGDIAGTLPNGGADARYVRETVARYAQVLLSLHELRNSVTALDERSSVELPPEITSLLGRVGLDAGMARLRHHRIAQMLSADGLTGTSAGFTRSSPLLERFQLVPGSGDQIGWQLQGTQWRLVVRVGRSSPGHGSGDRNATLREQYVAGCYGGFFDAAAVGCTEAPEQAAKWFRYAPDFVYRYVTVRPDITVGEVRDRALAAASGTAEYTG